MSFVGVGQILCVCPSFPFGIEGGIWDVIVLIPYHCLFNFVDVKKGYTEKKSEGGFLRRKLKHKHRY